MGEALLDPRFDLSRIDKFAHTIKDTAIGYTLMHYGMSINLQTFLRSDVKNIAQLIFPLISDPQIDLDAYYDDETLTVALAHELRHFAQSLHLDLTPQSVPLGHYIAINRFIEADASAIATAFAVELYRETGNKGYLDAAKHYEQTDILEEFLNAANPEQEIWKDRAPFIAAFHQWFNSKTRVEGYDQDAIEAHTRIRSMGLTTRFSKESDPRKSKKALLKDFSKRMASVSAESRYLHDVEFSDLHLK